MEENMTEKPRFEMVAKTYAGLEEVLADELRALPGAEQVASGNRMVSFTGTQETLYRANMQCRTALRILKPVEKFQASTTDELYDRLKAMPWGDILDVEKTFSIDSVVYSDTFTNSRYVTYRFKDAIVDWFQDRLGEHVRPKVRLENADVMFNIHISGRDVTVSVDSSGESLHKRGWRVDSTDAPISEVLAAGIILKSGWRGDTDLVDPMCGSGTFLVEAAMIAAGIMPGVYRKGFAFEQWPDFDRELFEGIYNDDSQERDNFKGRIFGADISRHALAVTEKNLKAAGVLKYVTLCQRDIADWTEAPSTDGVLVTNPPYGRRLRGIDLEALYKTLGTKLKQVFQGWHAWVISTKDRAFDAIGLAPSRKEDMYNGPLECQLREFVTFEGRYSAFREQGGTLGKPERPAEEERKEKPHRERRFEKGPKRFGDRHNDGQRREGPNPRYARPGDKRFGDKKPWERDHRPDDRRDRDYRDREKSVEQPSETELQLGRRRNPYLMRGITGKQPRLAPQLGMRRRRGGNNNDKKD